MVTRRNIGRADENSEEDGPVARTEPDPSRAKLDVANAGHYSGKGTGRGRHTGRRYRRIPPVLDGDRENPLPPDFREPHLKDYDGTTDPQASRPDLVFTLASSFHIQHIRSAEEILGPILSPKVEDDDFG
ncbi:pentatricopeptide repeat-containing protein [Sesbania bispinosa]|nr:pentatricopeptide repeat-containing protein [Sesbania bispinosa]